MKGVPRWLLLVAAMAAVGPVSIDMYLPGFPAIEREFGVRGVETTMAAYLVGIAVSQLFYGPISDRFGRKPPLYFGFALYALGAAGCALAASMPALTLMRVVQALGGSAGFVIGRAIVRDRCQPHEAARAFSLLMMIVALGPVFAPVAGGFVVTHFGWRATFVFQTALGVVLLAATHFALRESRPESTVVPLHPVNVLRTYIRLGKDRVLVGYSLVGGFAVGAMFAYVTGAPTVLTRGYDLSPQQFGALIGLNGLAFMSASRLNMIALRTLSPGQILARYVWMPVVFGAALFALTSLWALPLWMVVALQLSFFVTVGRVTPHVAALALAPHGAEAGAASALMGALQSALAMAAGFAVATFNNGMVSTLAVIMTAGGALALASYLWAGAASQSQEGLRRSG
ncbi:MAG TPA: multidrug effflux MFS transporter [Steroidobacteraceae bacterium]|jgi:DHA1 family bicyclomycin/chloramphenicol resistance-like MFS transporter|nr:multidrug effflux MFS transporter [Steroidobacteraceae bacterium]